MGNGQKTADIAVGNEAHGHGACPAAQVGLGRVGDGVENRAAEAGLVENVGDVCDDAVL